MDSIQIWHVLVTGFRGVPYFKVTLNSHVLKGYIEFTLFFNRVYWKQLEKFHSNFACICNWPQVSAFQ